jgi:hypothetical protein
MQASWQLQVGCNALHVPIYKRVSGADFCMILSVVDRIRIKLKGRIQILFKVMSRIRICIRIKVMSWIRIRISLQMTSQNVWNMSLFEHFFKGTRIRIQVTSRIRIRIK